MDINFWGWLTVIVAFFYNISVVFSKSEYNLPVGKVLREYLLDKVRSVSEFTTLDEYLIDIAYKGMRRTLLWAYIIIGVITAWFSAFLLNLVGKVEGNSSPYILVLFGVVVLTTIFEILYAEKIVPTLDEVIPEKNEMLWNVMKVIHGVIAIGFLILAGNILLA